tara:strand:- start:43 stop:1050 length:1008 start_codon:yes stop_codon:yes gene_type:complete
MESSDQRARRTERERAGSTELEDRAAVLREQVRTGAGSQEGLELGAKLGDEAAALALGEQDSEPPPNLKDEDLASLAGLSLTRLSLYRGEALTDAGFAHLGQLESLEHLHLHETPQLSEASLVHLTKLPRLRTFSASEGEIGDAGFATLASIATLEDLTLINFKAVGDAGVQALGELPALRSLCLSGCDQIGDAGVQALDPSWPLEQLRLSGCRLLGDAALEHLSQFTRLKTLVFGLSQNAANSQIKSLRFASLIMEDLTCLDGVSDAGVKRLAALRDLRELDLCGCRNMTDAGLDALAPLARLEKLGLGYCKKVTPVGRERLRTAIGSQLEFVG